VLVRQNALIAVSEYGKDAEPAIPAIAEMLNDKEHWVQTAALDALMRLHANPAVTIPALTPSLESTDVFVTLRVARVLLRFGPDARPAVPKMIEAFNRQTDERVRLALRRIIEEIEPGAMARAGIQ
jgi:HEAT repeat protein